MSLSARIVLASISVAAVGFFPPFFIPDRFPWEVSFGIGICLAIIWAGGLISCLVRFGKKRLWFLTGAPLVVFWPFYFFTFLWIVIR